MRVGVFNCQISINMSEIDSLYNYLLQHLSSRESKSTIRRELRKIQKNNDYISFKACLNKLSTAIYKTLETEKCPEAIKKLYSFQMEEPHLDFEEIYYGLDESKPKIISPTILYDINDVLFIEILEPSEEKNQDILCTVNEWKEITIDLTSLKKEGVSFFLNCLKSIPPINDALIVIKESKETHSSRYAFRPYALAVRLWLEKEAVRIIPKDLRDFLNNSSKHYTTQEWRTSTVLSAITTESLLADLYEEEYHESAPSKATLGMLFELAQKKVDFPENVKQFITMTNQARISAVHRSRFLLSDRAAINALYGAINFIMWYFSEYLKR